MKKFFKKPLPDLDERLDQVNERVRRARRILDWRTREARIPLDIQEDFGISELEGGIMLVSRDGDVHDKVRNLVRSEGYGCEHCRAKLGSRRFIEVGQISDGNC